MNLPEQIPDFLAGRILFPCTNYLLNRRGILRTYRGLMETERWPREQLTDLQLRRLLRALQNAGKQIPFYADRFRRCGFHAGDIKTLDDLRGLPPLSRQDVIDHHRELVDRRLQASVAAAERCGREPGVPAAFARFRRHRLVRNTSTGTTGTPTVFYEDGSTSALSWAHELRVKAWYGLSPGMREARVARVSASHAPGALSIRLRKRLWHQMILPGLNLTEEHYRECWQRLQEFQPRILFGLTSALGGLARCAGEGRLGSLRGLRLVVTWAEALFDHDRTLLADAFACPVTNLYGSRELGHIAAMCPAGSFHVNQENYLVELEDPGGPFGSGSLLVTTLFPTPMPFIRYRLGDVGGLAGAPCACGRSLQVLKTILGRTGDIIRTSDGRMIAPGFWCRLFMSDLPSRAVSAFQVVYRADGAFRLKIVRKENYTPETETSLMQVLQRNFPPHYRFAFEYVSGVDPEPSGKRKIVVNEATRSDAGGR